MPIVVYALAVSTFAIGTTECVIVGLLPWARRSSPLSPHGFRVAASFCRGSFIGGRVVERLGLTATPYVAIVIAVFALGITALLAKSKTLRGAESVTD